VPAIISIAASRSLPFSTRPRLFISGIGRAACQEAPIRRGLPDAPASAVGRASTTRRKALEGLKDSRSSCLHSLTITEMQQLRRATQGEAFEPAFASFPHLDGVADSLKGPHPLRAG
jgi:hypothetical protein